MLRLSSLLGLIFLLTACHAPVTYRPQYTPEEVRAEEARQRRMFEEIEAQGGLPKKWKSRTGVRKQFVRVAERIEKAGVELCRGIGIPNLDHIETRTEIDLQRIPRKRGCYYYFTMVADSDHNAYADGRTIFMNTGMMRFLESDDEVAIILAHELAHNLMEHSAATRSNAAVGRLLGLALESMAASQGYTPAGGMERDGLAIGSLAYTVSFEQEADYIGLYIAAGAGYDITRAPGFWQRMSMEYPDRIYNGVTHPSNAERHVALRKTIAEIQAKRKNRQPLLPEMQQGR